MHWFLLSLALVQQQVSTQQCISLIRQCASECLLLVVPLVLCVLFSSMNRKQVSATTSDQSCCTRVRLFILQDKAERKARGGKLAGKLGIEGYQPVGLQQDNSATPAASSGMHAATKRYNAAEILCVA
jgi:hypothetical protein